MVKGSGFSTEAFESSALEVLGLELILYDLGRCWGG